MTGTRLLDDRHVRFLRAVGRGGPYGPRTVENERIRRQCREEGLVEYVGKPPKWLLTERGSNMLELHDEPASEVVATEA